MNYGSGRQVAAARLGRLSRANPFGSRRIDTQGRQHHESP